LPLYITATSKDGITSLTGTGGCISWKLMTLSSAVEPTTSNVPWHLVGLKKLFMSEMGKSWPSQTVPPQSDRSTPKLRRHGDFFLAFMSISTKIPDSTNERKLKSLAGWIEYLGSGRWPHRLGSTIGLIVS